MVLVDLEIECVDTLNFVLIHQGLAILAHFHLEKKKFRKRNINR